MNSEGRVHHLIISLNPSYVVRPCFWARLPGFEEADAEAYAFIVGSVLKFKPRTLDLIFQQMSPLAIGVFAVGCRRNEARLRLLPEPKSPRRALHQCVLGTGPLCGRWMPAG